MIRELIPYYPEDRVFEQMSETENSLNWVIKTALGVPKVDSRRLRELREIIDEISNNMIVDEISNNMIGAGGTDTAEATGDGTALNIDRWTLYSAMIIHYMSQNPLWRYSRSEISRFISPEIAAMAYDNDMTDLMFTFAETLVGVRDKASYKRTGSIWWGPKAGGTREECEDRIRTLADEVRSYLEGTEAYHEYIMLTDRIFEDSQEQWSTLSGKGFNDLEDLFASIPERLILYKDTACTIRDVKKYREYAGRQQIDDIEFDMYETGVRLTLVLNRCGSAEPFELSISDWHSGRSCREILRRYDISIPDEKVRKTLKSM